MMTAIDPLPRVIDVVVDEDTKIFQRVLFDGRPCLLKGWTLTRKAAADPFPFGGLNREPYRYAEPWTLNGEVLADDFRLTMHLGKMHWNR